MSNYPFQRRPERKAALPQVRINERIRLREVRVIDDDGAQLGIMAPQQALEIARSKGLDLVEVAPQAQPPVCRIINYGKWQYEQKKKLHAAKQKQTTVTVKEIKFRPATDDHDYEFKKNNAVRMLQDGDKVKASVRFRGREITHRELGQQLLEKLEKDLSAYSVVEVRPKMEGMIMFLVFSPKSVKQVRPEKPAGERPKEERPRPQPQPQEERPRPQPQPQPQEEPVTGQQE